MFWTRKNKEEHRYYLLPGMGRSNRRKRQQFVRWAVVVGFLAGLGYWIIAGRHAGRESGGPA